MRVTTSMYYRDMQAQNSKTAKALFDVNRQISSGSKIQYAHEDAGMFIKTVRLDNEIAMLEQVKQSSNSGLKFSTNTDTTMNEFTTTLESFKVKLIQGANSGASSPTSRNALAEELDSLREHLSNLSNTSINGQYLFSGTASSTKPIDENGVYQGNDGDMSAFFGDQLQQKYNISGADLFLGEESSTKREITTNIALTDLDGKFLTSSDTILDLMDGNSGTQNFYVRGMTHDGDAIKKRVVLNDGDTINDLLGVIENTFGAGKVDVTLDQSGQIRIADKLDGSSKLDFHIVGNTGTTVDDLDDLGTLGEPVKAFIKSGLNSPATIAAPEEAVYDRTGFTQDGALLTSNIPQIVKSDNSFATDATKLSEVFSSMNADFHLEGVQRDGLTAYAIDIDFGADPAVDPVTVDLGGGVTYQVADGRGNATVANDMTYRQLMDVINMAVNAEVPTDLGDDYALSVKTADRVSEVALSHDGRIVFEEKRDPISSASIAIYDNNSEDFSNNDGPVALFNANNALTLRDPKTDFFARIDEAIQSVREGKEYADANSGEPRSGGMQSGIQMIDDLLDHVVRQHTKAGGQSQALQTANERNETLILSSMTLRSETIDTDIAESALRLQQLSLNYEAMLSTVSRITGLTLVNYL